MDVIDAMQLAGAQKCKRGPLSSDSESDEEDFQNEDDSLQEEAYICDQICEKPDTIVQA